MGERERKKERGRPELKPPIRLQQEGEFKLSNLQISLLQILLWIAIKEPACRSKLAYFLWNPKVLESVLYAVNRSSIS